MRYLSFWNVFLIDSKKMAKLFDGYLSLRKIFVNMIYNHFSNLLACKLVDICGKKHLAEFWFVNRVVLISIELVKKCNWIRMAGDVLVQFDNTYLDYFLFHFVLSQFLLFLPRFITLVIALGCHTHDLFQIRQWNGLIFMT